jgi:hypothetical protein
MKLQLSLVLHQVLNVFAVLGVWALVLLFDNTPWLAIAMVVWAKFRIFTVKPWFWLKGILSNSIDFVFGIGIAVLIWWAGQWDSNLVSAWQILLAQGVLTALYLAWTLFLKPRADKPSIAWQAGLAQFVGTVAVFAVSEDIILPVVLALLFCIGFSAARHMLLKRNEKQTNILAMVYGLMVAELGFLGYHWNLAYTWGLVKIPEMAVILGIFGFVLHRLYRSYAQHDGKIQQDEVLPPVLFGVILLVVILLFLSGLLMPLGF